MTMPTGPINPQHGGLNPRSHDARLVAGLDPERNGPGPLLCTRCGHSGRSHLGSSSCSHRGRWWRRCGCSSYTQDS
jgi:hypothetical protein